MKKTAAQIAVQVLTKVAANDYTGVQLPGGVSYYRNANPAGQTVKITDLAAARKYRTAHRKPKVHKPAVAVVAPPVEQMPATSLSFYEPTPSNTLFQDLGERLAKMYSYLTNPYYRKAVQPEIRKVKSQAMQEFLDNPLGSGPAAAYSFVTNPYYRKQLGQDVKDWWNKPSDYDLFTYWG